MKKIIKNKKLNFKNKEFLLIGFVVVFIILLGIFFSKNTNVVVASMQKLLNGIGIYTEEVEKIEIQTADYDSTGSWHIDKSARWTGTGKAQVVFDVNSILKVSDHHKDVVVVLDISGSMAGEKIEKVKSDLKDLIEILLSDSQNRVALITFDTSSEIISDFSNDKDVLLSKVDALTEKGSTNYYSGLLNVDKLMINYEKKSDTDIVTLFLTDGSPNMDTPNQIGVYESLKEKYPYMSINGIQYEMGNNIIDEIREISDNQWVADHSNLGNVLLDAAVSPVVYEDFIVTDYIYDDYFYVNSVDDIRVSMGTVKLEKEGNGQKIIWNLGKNSYMTGTNNKMYIDLVLKEQYVGSKGYYPTNKKETITSKLPDENTSTINSTSTPVLKNNYKVIYDANTPDGCSLEDIDSDTYFVYENVTKKTDELICKGYLFRGWVIDEDDAKDIQKVNDDVFLMPAHDVTIRATWGKQSIVKSMNGTINEKATLYNVLKNEATSGGYAKEYTGEHQDSMNVSGNKKIYYWYEDDDVEESQILNKNNVIFAGHCWQMIRTTDTGGVKMLYNGEAESGKCLNTRGNHVGFNGRSTQNLASRYYYGTSYTYDSASKSFSLDGEKTQATWNATTAPNLVGKYTCKSNNKNGTCSTLYYVESYYNASFAYVLSLNSASNYPYIGMVAFNSSYNSMAYLGYMYNEVYANNTKTTATTESMLSSSTLGTTYWYADEAVWGKPSASKWNLVDPYQVTEEEYSNLAGKYTFRNTSETYSATTVQYIAAVNNNTYYYISLANRNNLDYYNYTYTFGDSYRDNGDGTYTINNPTTIERKDWYNNYSKMNNKYVCKNATNNTCSTFWYTTSTYAGGFTYVTFANNYKYAKGFTYENGVYKLENDSAIEMFNLRDSSNEEKLNNAHYTCFNTSGECTTISYIYYLSDTSLFYINLTGGKGVEDAFSEMLSDNNVNTKNSIVKAAVDAWYERYMLDYTNYLEDTIYCNDRSIRSLGGWNPNGGNIKSILEFKNYDLSNDLSCTNVTDKFSVNNEKAKLKYPVGLMSAPEMNLLNNSNARKVGRFYWAISPYYFGGDGSLDYVVSSSGSLTSYITSVSNGVRPAISLKPGTEYSAGDGSMENPYIIN